MLQRLCKQAVWLQEQRQDMLNRLSMSQLCKHRQRKAQAGFFVEKILRGGKAKSGGGGKCC